MVVALLGGLLAEYFLGIWWADYLATGIILAFVAKEAVESRHELQGKRATAPEQSDGPLHDLGFEYSGA